MEQRQADERGVVKSADRVLDLFELLAGPANEMSHAEIADALAIPKSSLSQLLATLHVRGYLAFSHERRSWRLGERLLQVAGARPPGDLPTIALPVLQALTEATRESSALNLLEGGEAVVAATVMGPLRLVSHMRLGDRAPLYATSGGKAILAFLDAGERNAYLSRVKFSHITPSTLASAAALRRQIAAVRKEGVAYSMEEYTAGIVGIAVPLMPPGAAAPIAINVAMPAVRFDDAARESVCRCLNDAAARLMRLLGG